MLKESKEITALLHLIDDPDEYVYNTVSEKIMSLGRPIIPNLETLWEQSLDPAAQDRIESLIHRLQFRDLESAFEQWAENPFDLVEGCLLVGKYTYPDLDAAGTRLQLEKMRRNVWLELNSFLTPMEQVNVMNSIVFNYYKHRGTELDYEMPDQFLLHKTIESKKGNAISNGLLYMILSQRLDVPIKALNIPRQFIMGYFNPEKDELHTEEHSSANIKFYIDGLSGQMYSQKDLENYFKRISVPPLDSFYRPMDNKETIGFLLAEYGKCYAAPELRYKRDEIMKLFMIVTK